jgi:glycosyltransferase involved in cell wall biosynthesis
MLSRCYSFAKSIDEADVVILHLEPHNYESIYNALPNLRNKFVISYCVWEASELPVAYQRSLALVQEVWTCSEYCLSIIKKHHARVFRIPHTIERETASHDVDDAIIRRLISFDPRNYYFLSIGRTLGARKNLKELVRIFEATASSMPNARLIIKGLPGDPILRSQDPRVFYLPITFSASQMNALYKAADVYVSAHHSEGWGLTLSDAMLFGKPVVATGYSGNLEFMSHDNSFLIRCAENYIREDDVFALFTTQMKWADPSPNHLENVLISLYKGDLRTEAAQKSKRALEDSKHFSNDSVNRLVLARVESIQLELGV